MRTRELKTLPFMTADAESLNVYFNGISVRIEFMDIRQDWVAHEFPDVLGFKWSIELAADVLDDRAYEVLDSDWLREQARLWAVEERDHAHIMLCMSSASGVLEVLVPRSALVYPTNYEIPTYCAKTMYCKTE